MITSWKSLVPNTTFVAALRASVLLLAPFSFVLADNTGYAVTYSSGSTAYRQDTASGTRCGRPDERTLTAIVQVATDHGSHASGIVFDDNRVLTAAHALQGAGHFFVRVGSGYRSADLVMVDHTNDLAVLAVDTSLIKPLVISVFNPSQMDPVWAAGYPRAEEISMSMGVFKRVMDGALYTSATIHSGQSGGGLLSCTKGRWMLVGMLRGYGVYLQGDHYVKMENHSVSVAGTTINEFLRTYR
ncbi:MAG: trypsin-like peptidase domain-containing protein [Granulosicoccus sp.]